MSTFAALALSAVTLLSPQGDPQANLVVIVSDQLAHWATDPAQRAPLDMPVLDALAASGTTYSRCYATVPVCAANRLALLSGQYPFSLGTNKLAAGTPDLGSILTAAGWDTAYIGKWHLSPGGGSPTQYVWPIDRTGWRFFSGNEGAPHNYVAGESFRREDRTPISTAPWEPTWNTVEAVRFLRANHSRPFALVVNYGPPHAGGLTGTLPTYLPSQITTRPNVALAQTSKALQAIAGYMNLCLTLDAELGVLLAEIDLSNTYVLFTSDHGDMLYSQGLKGNQHKRRPWEESSHIPLILAGPGIASGSTDASLISTVDLTPSVLSLLGVPAPGVLQGSPFPKHAPVYLGHNAKGNSWLGQRWRALVREDIKYAVTEDGAELMYDLVQDPYELTDLAADPAYRPLLVSMRRAIQRRSRDVGDPFFE